MSDERKLIENYPDISFIENYTVSQLEEDMVNWYKEKKTELDGSAPVLASGDERRLILSVCAYFLYQGYKYIDVAGKMGLLKYSTGDYLENMAALKQISRKEATGATTTIRFSMVSARTVATPIAQGTRMTAGDGVYFATDEYAEIAAGDTYVDVGATCTTSGSAGNDYGIGEISKIVDPVAFIDAAENITAPENGTDTESDEDLKNRIYVAPNSYSVAGPENAYKALALEFNSSIADVAVTSPSENVVNIVYLLDDGEIPGEESMSSLLEYLSAKTLRPLTDKVQVNAPDTVDCEVSLTYYINQSDSASATLIQEAVEQAVEEYCSWQRCKLGRDINPSELIRLVMAAGAKRVDVESPVYTTVDETEVASISDTSVNYGGLEDD